MTAHPQTSDSVLLVRPAGFAFHPEAARSNAFADGPGGSDVSALALAEFDALHQRLQDAGVDCLVLEDHPEPAKPDAVFPNNMVSFHGDGMMILYPMATAARRLERRPKALAALVRANGLDIRRTVDLSPFEEQGHYLEGTGSLVLDRPGCKAFAALGPRTNSTVIAAFDSATGTTTHMFAAADRSGRSIYHTNVLLSLGSRFAILCGEAVAAAAQAPLIAAIEAGRRSIIDVTFDQMGQFACNALELKARDGTPLIALSASAMASFTPHQQRQLERFGEFVAVPIPVIEQVGGGSVRCMIAEVHLPRLNPGS
ncbi:MAG: arginine deiminase-related protein [Sphingomicrobium sp.]